MKMLVINDVHVAATPPRQCKPAYTEDVFNMLLEARDIAGSNGVELTVFTGDMFHSKINVAHWLVRRLIEIFGEWPGQLLAIAGNHDQGAEGLASIPRQPLGVLFESGVLEWLREDIIYGSHDGQSILLSPANWFEGIDDDPANFGLTRPDNVTWAIKVAHGSLLKPRKEPWPFEGVTFDEVPTEGMDLCLFGHIHNDQGITEVNDCIFASLGSLGRVAQAEYNIRRKMRLLQVTLTKDEITFEKIPLLSAVPAEELYYEKAGPDVELDEPMARFARKIEKMLSVEETPLEDLLATVGTGVDQSVVRAVKKHLEEAGWE